MVLTELIWLNWTFFGDNLALLPKEVFPDVFQSVVLWLSIGPDILDSILKK
jgi:hypothetical protein